MTDIRTIISSNGTPVVLLGFGFDTEDFLGRPCRIIHDMQNIETPYGNRLQTTVYIYPDGDVKKVYVGATLQAPSDQHNHDEGFKWALFRASQDMLMRNLSIGTPEYHFALNKRMNPEPALKRWSNHVLRFLRHSGYGPSATAEKLNPYVNMDVEELKRVIKEGNW